MSEYREWEWDNHIRRLSLLFHLFHNKTGANKSAIFQTITRWTGGWGRKEKEGNPPHNLSSISAYSFLSSFIQWITEIHFQFWYDKSIEIGSSSSILKIWFFFCFISTSFIPNKNFLQISKNNIKMWKKNPWKQNLFRYRTSDIKKFCFSPLLTILSLFMSQTHTLIPYIAEWGENNACEGFFIWRGIKRKLITFS